MLAAPLTEQVVTALRKMPRKPKGQLPPRPSARALRRATKLLSDYEFCKMPYPEIFATKEGVRLLWKSLLREIQLEIDQDGDMTFATALKTFDSEGELVHVINGDGHIEGPKGVDRIMAWFLSDLAAQA